MEFNKPSSPIPGEHDEEKAPQLQEQESTNLDKNGLRVDGDDEDHSHETPVCLSSFSDHDNIEDARCLFLSH
jgi:hypothetical protein